mmetsp:Transcript_138/g.411  ORF Transcript_138/g.411 Transcript_138/m.411 type:complete len:465 (-) Transcript_138:144-1538(-)
MLAFFLTLLPLMFTRNTSEYDSFFLSKNFDFSVLARVGPASAELPLNPVLDDFEWTKARLLVKAGFIDASKCATRQEVEEGWRTVSGAAAAMQGKWQAEPNPRCGLTTLTHASSLHRSGTGEQLPSLYSLVDQSVVEFVSPWDFYQFRPTAEAVTLPPLAAAHEAADGDAPTPTVQAASDDPSTRHVVLVTDVLEATLLADLLAVSSGSTFLRDGPADPDDVPPAALTQLLHRVAQLLRVPQQYLVDNVGAHGVLRVAAGESLDSLLPAAALAPGDTFATVALSLDAPGEGGLHFGPDKSCVVLGAAGDGLIAYGFDNTFALLPSARTPLPHSTLGACASHGTDQYFALVQVRVQAPKPASTLPPVRYPATWSTRVTSGGAAADAAPDGQLSIEFFNTRSAPVSIFWRNPTSAEEVAMGGALNPKKTFSLNSYDTHAFVVREQDGTEVATFVVQEGGDNVFEIR